MENAIVVGVHGLRVARLQKGNCTRERKTDRCARYPVRLEAESEVVISSFQRTIGRTDPTKISGEPVAEPAQYTSNWH